ncbi:MAG: hypothetical protein HY901_13480 [Deltaproteobacteria bacterium]|nr:hypothetical protein [Deltaproteobacteria bacterium]
MNADREIGEVLSEFGFADPAATQEAREALVRAGLTRPGKARISDAKLDKVRALLEATFARTCTDATCRTALSRSKPAAALLTVPKGACEHCGGSDNLKAMRRLSALCRARHLHRVVVVGGSPSVREELIALKPPEWNLRLIDGTERRTGEKARADLEWAHLLFVWGSSELDHRVSKLYTDTASPHRHKVVQLARRGIAALLNAGSEHVERLQRP